MEARQSTPSSLMRRPLGVRALAVLLVCLGLGAASWAVPVYSSGTSGASSGSGTIVLSGSGSIPVTFKIEGDAADLQGYTFGIVNLNKVTAALDDPDFALQALMADSATVLHETGSAVSATYSATMASGSQFCLFFLRDATLADFSRGQNAYQPIFTMAGTGFSSLIKQETLASGGILYTIQTSFATDGGVVGCGGSEAAYFDGNEAVVTPEPATIILWALGLGGVGLAQRLRRSRQTA